MPGAVRPARPARCSADACEIGTSSSRGKPVAGETRICRACPESITAVTPSIVSEVSATFVARMIFRCPRVVEHPVLLLGRQIAKQRQKRMALALGQRGKRLLAPHDLSHARQKHEHVPRRRRATPPARSFADPVLKRRPVRPAARTGPAPETAGLRHGRSGNRPTTWPPAPPPASRSSPRSADRAARLADSHQHPQHQIHLDRPLVKLIDARRPRRLRAPRRRAIACSKMPVVTTSRPRVAARCRSKRT